MKTMTEFIDESNISSNFQTDNYLLINSLRQTVYLHNLRKKPTIDVNKFEKNFKDVYLKYKNDSNLDLCKILNELINI